MVKVVEQGKKCSVGVSLEHCGVDATEQPGVGGYYFSNTTCSNNNNNNNNNNKLSPYMLVAK